MEVFEMLVNTHTSIHSCGKHVQSLHLIFSIANRKAGGF